MELTDFLHAGTNSCKLTGDWKFLGVSMIKNGCGQSGDRTLKLAVSEEWAGGINWLFACSYRFTNIKSWSRFFWVGMVKNGCGHSGHWTLEFTVSHKWTDGINWFLHAGRNSGKLKIDDFWWVWLKWPWPFSSWDPKICCILIMNLWIELIFWMVIVMQYFLVRLISYSLTFKCRGSTAVVLLALMKIQKSFKLTLKFIANI